MQEFFNRTKPITSIQDVTLLASALSKFGNIKNQNEYDQFVRLLNLMPTNNVARVTVVQEMLVSDLCSSDKSDVPLLRKCTVENLTSNNPDMQFVGIYVLTQFVGKFYNDEENVQETMNMLRTHFFGKLENWDSKYSGEMQGISTIQRCLEFVKDKQHLNVVTAMDCYKLYYKYSAKCSVFILNPAFRLMQAGQDVKNDDFLIKVIQRDIYTKKPNPIAYFLWKADLFMEDKEKVGEAFTQYYNLIIDEDPNETQKRFVETIRAKHFPNIQSKYKFHKQEYLLAMLDRDDWVPDESYTTLYWIDKVEKPIQMRILVRMFLGACMLPKDFIKEVNNKLNEIMP